MPGPDSLDALMQAHGAVPTAPAAAPPAAPNPLDALMREHGAIVPDFTTHAEKPSLVDLGLELVKGFGELLNPLPLLKAMYDRSAHEFEQGAAAASSRTVGGFFSGLAHNARGAIAPAETAATEVVGAHVGQLRKAYAAYQQGNVSEALGHTLAAMLPLAAPVAGPFAFAGPAAAGVGEEIGTGDPRAIARGVGGAIALTAGPEIVGATVKAVLPNRTVTVPPLRPNPNPAEVAAVNFGEQHGIPVDLTAATGSASIGKMQGAAGANPGGASIAERFRQQQVEGFQRVGNEIADRVNAPSAGQRGVPVSRVDAGQNVVTGLTDRIQALDLEANTAYGVLQTIEADPRNIRSVVARAGEPAAPMPMPVDLRQAKVQLRPLFTRLAREKDLVGVLQGKKGQALVALDKLVNGDDFAPASVVDDALGDLKAMSRGADLPELRTESQGAAALAVRSLETTLRDTVARAGPRATQALEDGRRATRTKWEIADVRDLFNVDEPGGVFQKLVNTKDRSIGLLQKVEAASPGQLPHIGRAVLEDMIETATAEGGFAHADKLWADWRRLGPETKRLLFGSHVQDLDNFFLLAKQVGKSPNASGTALMLEAGKVSKIPLSYLVAKLAYSPGAVRALSRGVSLSLTSSGAAMKAQAAASLARAAHAAGVSLDDEAR